MRALYVPLEPELLNQLRKLADRERRSTRQQATFMLEQAIRNRDDDLAERTPLMAATGG